MSREEQYSGKLLPLASDGTASSGKDVSLLRKQIDSMELKNIQPRAKSAVFG
jgi:hypothetical protein